LGHRPEAMSEAYAEAIFSESRWTIESAFGRMRTLFIGASIGAEPTAGACRKFPWGLAAG